jgi:hypothetical protein
MATRAFAAARLIRAEQGITHLSPIQHRICRVLQCAHTESKILDVVEVVLDRLANEIRTAALELMGSIVKLLTRLLR